ncbi:MAG: hypothetical protein LBH55_04430 [Mycoplasmataceae bacterium]|jgi:hypothetical protein|nr:hypothetical protein [Mycoplasmataceae bacterium]
MGKLEKKIWAKDFNTLELNFGKLIPKGKYSGEFSQEAYEIIHNDLSKEDLSCETAWYDIFLDEEKNEYALYGTDTIRSNSYVYCVSFLLSHRPKKGGV